MTDVHKIGGHAHTMVVRPLGSPFTRLSVSSPRPLGRHLPANGPFAAAKRDTDDESQALHSHRRPQEAGGSVSIVIAAIGRASEVCS